MQTASYSPIAITPDLRLMTSLSPGKQKAPRILLPSTISLISSL